MALTISATTRLAAVIGDPVRHSMSPQIHNAAFDACGVDGVYVALPVAPGDAAQAVADVHTTTFAHGDLRPDNFLIISGG